MEKSMNKVTRVAVSFIIAAAPLWSTLDASAQDKAKSPAAKSTALSSFLCKDVMRMSGEDRQIAIGVMHGYFLGKKGATSYVSESLSKASDDFTEYCLDHPSDKAFDAFAKFVK
jgi:hypothetical protein